MIIMKNRLVFGFIRKLIGGVLKFIYKLIALLNLQLPLLVFLIGLILYVTGAIEDGGATSSIFYLALALSIAIAVISTTKRVLGLGKKVSKGKGVQIVNGDAQKQEIEETQENSDDNTEGNKFTGGGVPRYFKVKNHADYYMAEYPDRYELYKMSNGNMIKVRTDLKH